MAVREKTLQSVTAAWHEKAEGRFPIESACRLRRIMSTVNPKHRRVIRGV